MIVLLLWCAVLYITAVTVLWMWLLLGMSLLLWFSDEVVWLWYCCDAVRCCLLKV